MDAAPVQRGLILFAHGARDAAWAAPFEAVAALVRQRQPAWQVRLAFLELMRPSLGEAAAALVHGGCTQVTVRPMFLGTGGHVRRDLPPMLDELRRAHPGVGFALHVAIGEEPAVHAAMAEAMAGAIAEATAGAMAGAMAPAALHQPAAAGARVPAATVPAARPKEPR
ncbi:MAG: CbiX/SirB N-terminal domain-containing protein [Rubrivivax sp.]|nr:CbiX/SirB N-terminal domain-containing protein [Rubrivivax sp.]